MVLWWVPAGHRPRVAEAEERLARLRAQGPSAQAFTFRRQSPAPDSRPAEVIADERDLCPA